MKHKIIFRFALTACLFLTASLAADAQAFSCPSYTTQRAAALVKAIYNEVLEREVDESGLISFSSQLRDGKMCVQEVVRSIGTSPEYAKRFIQNQTPTDAIVLMYRHFLLREPENGQVVKSHVNDMNGKGWQAKVLDFVNSPEAANVWAKFNPKPKPQGNKALLDQGCKFFLGRNNDYLCLTQEGFNLCEKLKKDGKNSIVSCRLAGVKQK